MRRSLAAAAVLALAVAIGVTAASGRPDPRGALAQAVGAIPAGTGTASFTDWSRVRAEVGDDLDAGSPASAAAFLSAAYAHDLTSVSVLSAAQETMEAQMGWSVLDLRWEMYAQSRRGAVLVLALSPSTGPGTVVDGLRRVGYAPPDDGPDGGTDGGADDGGVWRTNDAVAVRAPGLPDQLSDVAVLGDERLVVASDRRAYAQRTVEMIRGAAPSFGDRRATLDLVRTLRSPDVAVLHAARTGCSSTSFDDAAEADRNGAARAAGDSLEAHHGLALGLREHDGVQRMRVAMRFSSTARAQEQTAVRRRLATGDAIGQGGTFAERFGVSGASTDGAVGVLDLRLRSPRAQALSDLGEGPLLFAWCGP